MKRLILLLYGCKRLTVPIENEQDECCLKEFRKNMSEYEIVETFIDDSTTAYLFKYQDTFNLARLHWNTLQNIKGGFSLL